MHHILDFDTRLAARTLLEMSRAAETPRVLAWAVHKSASMASSMFAPRITSTLHRDWCDFHMLSKQGLLYVCSMLVRTLRIGRRRDWLHSRSSAQLEAGRVHKQDLQLCLYYVWSQHNIDWAQRLMRLRSIFGFHIRVRAYTRTHTHAYESCTSISYMYMHMYAHILYKNDIYTHMNCKSTGTIHASGWMQVNTRTHTHTHTHTHTCKFHSPDTRISSTYTYTYETMRTGGRMRIHSGCTPTTAKCYQRWISARPSAYSGCQTHKPLLSACIYCVGRWWACVAGRQFAYRTPYIYVARTCYWWWGD